MHDSKVRGLILEDEPIMDDIPVDRTHVAKETPVFTENRRTISDIREARKNAEGSGGESEDGEFIFGCKLV